MRSNDAFILGCRFVAWNDIIVTPPSRQKTLIMAARFSMKAPLQNKLTNDQCQTYTDVMFWPVNCGDLYLVNMVKEITEPNSAKLIIYVSVI